MYTIEDINLIFSLGGLALGLITIFLYFDYLFLDRKYYRRYLHRFAWNAIIAVTVGSVVISLFYSEYLGFIPCSLCWLQRIALYPQALFVVMAFRTKEAVYFPFYNIGLSIAGLIVALYQYIYQLVPAKVSSGIMPCLADGSGDCALKVIDTFGFVTFPLLSAITFAFLIVVYLNLRKAN
ncbi:MAG: disulfide bond formation protein B [Patescibacteria group bacterium]